ncbi:hypothetical protein [uncultured Dokdonia sp.]|uniref:hypothetical protein n=1 Tax=uncultured Dokdonia sp. TaxID=575653 RepID=UPI00262E0F5F|nr:hypothetical protein [uncultured Dokdonia sp.]
MKTILKIIVLTILFVNTGVYSQNEYYELSDTAYTKILKSKDKKEITLEDGSLAYLMNFQEIARVSAISPEVLKALNEYYCSLPLAPGDLCEGNCRDCPQGYFCGYIERPSIQLYSEMFKNQKTPTIKGISKNIADNYFVVRKPVKKCIALPNR